MKIETQIEWAGHDGIDAAVIAEVARRIHEQVEQEIRERVEEMVTRRASDLVDEKLGTMIEEALLMEFQPTNGYGDAQGEPTNLRGIIVARSQKLLAPVRDGRREREFGGRDRPVLERVIDEQCGSAMEKELKGDIDQARKQVKAAVRAKAAAMIENTINRLGKGWD